MNWKQIATVGALLLCLLVLWMHRYEYVRQTDVVLIRSNKFTGSTEQLVGTSSSWTPVGQPRDGERQEPDAASQQEPESDRLSELELQLKFNETRTKLLEAEVDSLHSVVRGITNE